MKQIRMTVWLDEAEHERFKRLFPNYGAFTRIARALIHQHMQKVEKQAAALLEEK